MSTTKSKSSSRKGKSNSGSVSSSSKAVQVSKSKSASSCASLLIKGGGRAAWSKQSEECIISLLQHLRDSNHPLLPKQRNSSNSHKSDNNSNNDSIDTAPTTTEEATTKSHKTSSQHSQSRERKRFVKRLVECHNREALARRLNNTSNHRTEQQKQKQQKPSLSASSGRVRIEVVEAIFSTSVSGQSDKKQKGKRPFKTGSVRKMLVLPRSTTVEELSHQCKSKLRMKKRPQRLFCVGAGIEDSIMEIVLTSNLTGLEDGATVYATTSSSSLSSSTRQNNHSPVETKKGDISKENDGDTTNNHDNDNDMILFADPLDAVKRAYSERRKQKNQKRLDGDSGNSPQGKQNRSCSGGSSSNLNSNERQDKPSSLAQPPKLFSQYIHGLPPITDSRKELPAAAYREEILKSLDSHRVVIIKGETGCGKSTQVPQFLLEGLQSVSTDNMDTMTTAAGTAPLILVTQPRRVAAISLAERVATERFSPAPGKAGSQVGYSVRLARAVAPTCKIVYCTVGILLRMLIHPTTNNDDNDGSCGGGGGDGETESKEAVPLLSSVSFVVMDEVHERDLDTDVCLTLLRPLLQSNKRLRILLMSATASTDLFVDYFRETNSERLKIDPKVISIPGRTFPVATHWLEDCERLAGAHMAGPEQTNDIVQDYARNNEHEQLLTRELGVAYSPRVTTSIDNIFLCKLISGIVRNQQTQTQPQQQERRAPKKDGSILVFLPGKGEIEALARTLYKDITVGNKDKCRIMLLHSSVPVWEQQAVFQLPKAGTVKVVLATNIAETSITIPDISVVIDTGRVKESRFQPATRIKELVTVWTSQASATQRAGRAGRVSAGVCFKIYTEEHYTTTMPQRTVPEMFRSPLDDLVLQVCLLYEKQRDEQGKCKHSPPNRMDVDMIGTSPVTFLRRAPEPPPTRHILHACNHLLEAGALVLTQKEPELLFRLTPLGYHLSHLPMDAKVGKVLIVGCILECINSSLTVAAALSCSKMCWSPCLPGRPSTKSLARDRQKRIVEDGFGGTASPTGGTAKGDLIGTVAAYNAWASHRNDKERRSFARENALEHNTLNDMHRLRMQFRSSLVDAGFLDQSNGRVVTGSSNDDASLTSCCLVAGLYPNICTLMRPNKMKRIREGRLITKDGSACRPSSSSFQADRVRNASESGKDAYAVFHSKHRSVGATTSSTKDESFLSEVNFVSRFSLLLFGGDIEVKDNAVVIDDWLKFKVGDKGERIGAVLIQELRKELDNIILKRITGGLSDEKEDGIVQSECREVMEAVRTLLAEE